jgi:hypothetical protein
MAGIGFMIRKIASNLGGRALVRFLGPCRPPFYRRQNYVPGYQISREIRQRVLRVVPKTKRYLYNYERFARTSPPMPTYDFPKDVASQKNWLTFNHIYLYV